jgi:hypothetical protein
VMLNRKLKTHKIICIISLWRELRIIQINRLKQWQKHKMRLRRSQRRTLMVKLLHKKNIRKKCKTFRIIIMNICLSLLLCIRLPLLLMRELFKNLGLLAFLPWS